MSNFQRVYRVTLIHRDNTNKTTEIRDADIRDEMEGKSDAVRIPKQTAPSWECKGMEALASDSNGQLVATGMVKKLRIHSTRRSADKREYMLTKDYSGLGAP